MIGCDQFRNGLEKSLNHNPSPGLSEEMRLHLSSCKSCGAYYASSIALHRALLEIPKEQMSPGLTARLKSIGRLPEPQPVRLSWMPELKRGALLLGPAVAMIAAYWLPPITGTITQFVVLIGGLTLLVSNILKPAFIGHQ